MGGADLAAIKEKYVVTVESFDSIASYRHNAGYALRWRCPFVLPEWLRAWWSEFGAPSEPYIVSARQGEDLIGIAPLLVKGKKASFIGDADVCDYLDFVVTPGRTGEFFSVLLDHFSKQGITQLDLGSLRPDSTVLSDLVDLAGNRGFEVSRSLEDISLELDLPGSWDEYLGMLNGKQRHEIKRKFRKLYEAASINFRVVEDIKEIAKEMNTFLALFELGKMDKAAFMTEKMASFFRSLAEAMAQAKILKLYILEFNAVPAAVSMCFDFNSTIYLYNSSYDPRFRSLSVGLLCKVLSIKDSIQRGRKKYDFLKGAEAYKYRLGGKEVPLYKCEIRIG